MRVPKRTLVYAPKDDCTGLYVILDGEIKLIGPKKKGREKVIALLGRNHWFGETALVLRQRHISGAKTADTATTLLHLPRSVVLECLNQDHAFALRLLSATCERLQLAYSMPSVWQRRPFPRVIGFLLEQVPSSIVTGPVTITLSVPKTAIASHLNISPEHLSRVFGHLADAQMIEVDGPYVLMCDVARFRKAATTSGLYSRQ